VVIDRDYCRYWKSQLFFYKLLESTLAVLPEITKIVSGGAKGADSLAEIYAEKYQLPLIVFKPDWQKYGRGAGIVRNREIIEAADMVVAFWDGSSKGTASSLKFAKSKGILIQTVIF
jgi:hypothetical protein